MDVELVVLSIVCGGLAVLALVGWLWGRGARRSARQAKASFEQQLADQAAAADQRLADQKASVEQFGGIASRVLREMREDALSDVRSEGERTSTELQSSVDNVVKPLREQLEQLQKRNAELQQFVTDTKSDYGSVGKQLVELSTTTSQLTHLLSNSALRGKWAEQQLQRIFDLSGMTEGVDYDVQKSIPGASAQRPDAVVYLPNHLAVVVDAKAPFDAYRRAIEAPTDAERKTGLKSHADAVASHAKALGSKDYQAGVAGSVRAGQTMQFVVMFLPMEGMLQATVTVNPTLWEEAWTKHKVLIATPGVLVALLHTVALSWSWDRAQEQADAIAALGTELYDRLGTFADHLTKTRTNLNRTVKSFDDGIGSFNSRLVPSAQRLAALRRGATAKSVAELEAVGSNARRVSNLVPVEELDAEEPAPELEEVTVDESDDGDPDEPTAASDEETATSDTSSSPDNEPPSESDDLRGVVPPPPPPIAPPNAAAASLSSPPTETAAPTRPPLAAAASDAAISSGGPPNVQPIGTPPPIPRKQ